MSTIFDMTSSEDIVKFSEAIRTLMNEHTQISANNMFVIFHFYAAQCMQVINGQAVDRVTQREKQQLSEDSFEIFKHYKYDEPETPQ